MRQVCSVRRSIAVGAIQQRQIQPSEMIVAISAAVAECVPPSETDSRSIGHVDLFGGAEIRAAPERRLGGIGLTRRAAPENCAVGGHS